MTSPDPKMCCEAVRSAILATAWLLVTCAPCYHKSGDCCLSAHSSVCHDPEIVVEILSSSV